MRTSRNCFASCVHCGRARYDKFHVLIKYASKQYGLKFCRLLRRKSATGWPRKLAQFLNTPQLHQILTDIQNCFTVRIRRKVVIILSLKIPPHLKCVATLPREMSIMFCSVSLIARHWSVASPAWVRRPAATRTHWTFDVKTAGCDTYFRQ